jgi:hypothetical protein
MTRFQEEWNRISVLPIPEYPMQCRFEIAITPTLKQITKIHNIGSVDGNKFTKAEHYNVINKNMLWELV